MVRLRVAEAAVTNEVGTKKNVFVIVTQDFEFPPGYWGWLPGETEFRL